MPNPEARQQADPLMVQAEPTKRARQLKLRRQAQQESRLLMEEEDKHLGAVQACLDDVGAPVAQARPSVVAKRAGKAPSLAALNSALALRNMSMVSQILNSSVLNQQYEFIRQFDRTIAQVQAQAQETARRIASLSLYI